MSDNLTQTGLGLLAFQGITGHQFDITLIIGKSFEYNDLLEQLKTQEKFFALLPENDTEERLKVSAKINELANQIEQFKQDVLKLAKAFQNIEINTERLNRAKDFFDKGEIGKARAVLETELEQMQCEQKHLLKEREHYETETLPKLQNNSEEFYLLALSIQADYANPDRFEDTCLHFRHSIESYPTKSNVFQYAYFLWEHDQFPEAEYFYRLYLQTFKEDITKHEYAMTLNNLAILHRNQNEYEKAFKEYEEALHIYRQLAEINSQNYLPYVAGALNNLAVLHQNQNEYRKVLKKYQEALQIYRQLAKTDSQTYLPNVATTLNNLATFHQNQGEYEKASKEYKEALRISRQLAEINPQTYLCDVATTLNNLAILHNLQNECKTALKNYEEALDITIKLFEKMPDVYTPDVSMTLVNISIFYQESLPDRERSIEHAVEAMIILSSIVEKIPYMQSYMETAMIVLEDWGLNTKEIKELINEKQSGKMEK